MCFGRGKCDCGVCQCQDPYEGKFCQRSRDLDTCQKLEPCVKAHQFRNENSTDDDARNVLLLQFDSKQ